MKHLILLFIGSIFSNVLYADSNTICLNIEDAKRHECEVELDEEKLAFCQYHYGPSTLPYFSSSQCQRLGQVFQFDDFEKQLTSKFQQIDMLLKSIDGAQLLGDFNTISWSSSALDILVEVQKLLMEVNQRYFEMDQIQFRSLLENEKKKIADMAYQYHVLKMRLIKIERAYRYSKTGNANNTNDEKNDRLNLNVTPELGQTILAHYNLKAKWSENRIEFLLTEYEKVVVELFTLSQARTEEEYAKLLGFMAIRDSLSNAWALNRMTDENILANSASCREFTSFENFPTIGDIPSVKENQLYEIYSENLMPKIGQMLDEFIPQKFLDGRFKFRDNLIQLNESYPEDRIYEELNNYTLDLFSKKLQEKINILLLPGDHFEDKMAFVKTVSSRLTNLLDESFNEALNMYFVWEYEKTRRYILNKNQSYLKRRLNHFKLRMKHLLIEKIENKDFEIKAATFYLDEKIEQTNEVLEKIVPFLNPRYFKLPASIQELTLFFNQRLQNDEFSSLLYTYGLNSNVQEVFQELMSDLLQRISTKGIDLDDELGFYEEFYMSMLNLAQKYNVDKGALVGEEQEEMAPLVYKAREEKIEKALKQNPELINLLHPKIRAHYVEQYTIMQENIRQQFSLSKKEETKRVNKEKWKGRKVLTKEEIVQEFLRVFKFVEMELSLLRKSFSGYLSLNEIRAYNNEVIKQATSLFPILSLKVKGVEKVKRPIFTPYGEMSPYEVEQSISYERSFLKEVYAKAYDRTNDKIDESIVRELMVKVVTEGSHVIKDQVDQLCAMTYEKIDDENFFFKKFFKNSYFLRQSIRDILILDEDKKQKFNELDYSIEKKLKTTTDNVNEYFVVPALVVLGTISLVGLGFVGAAALMGSGATNALIAMAGASQLFLGSVTINSSLLVLTTAHTYHNLNQQFIEIPAQVKYQRRMLKTQIENANIYSADQIDTLESSNLVNKYLTVGLIPIDLYFGVKVLKD